MLQVFVLLLSIVPTIAQTSDDPPVPNVKFTAPDETRTSMPRGPSHYPAALQGVIWMDQAGFVSLSDMGDGKVDLSKYIDGAVSFGDLTNPLDKATQSIFIDTAGPAWQWFSSTWGYWAWSSIKFRTMSGMLAGGTSYRFQFNEDYTYCDIYTAYWGWELPKQILSFSFTLQQPMPGVCPPAKNASKAAFTRCAKWRRGTYMINPFWVYNYYVFEIIDKDGSPVQPYYDKYLEWVEESTEPDAKYASDQGLLWTHVSDSQFERDRVFVGIGSERQNVCSTLVWWLVALVLVTLLGILAVLCFKCCRACCCKRSSGRELSTRGHGGQECLLP